MNQYELNQLLREPPIQLALPGPSMQPEPTFDEVKVELLTVREGRGLHQEELEAFKIRCTWQVPSTASGWLKYMESNEIELANQY